jgi:catechol 2,3-dioxygenase-like lactoylglutathione lyase family enzyme
MATFRYIVKDVDEAVKFYKGALGFDLQQQFGPAMAILRRSDLNLWLAGPVASASQPMPDGRKVMPGGWNRVVLEVDDLDAAVARLQSLGVSFRNEILSGPGGRQILCDDPSGNPIELFEAR